MRRKKTALSQREEGSEAVAETRRSGRRLMGENEGLRQLKSCEAWLGGGGEENIRLYL